tara:strand:+ start:189 stop:584 length:396 start_codon:yes stop_codon:yes gene_type:complete
MIEDDFYATVKFKSGEEIFAKIAASEENDKTILLVSNPVVIKEVKGKNNEIKGYKIEPWLKSTTEDMFVIDIENVLTMSESSDIEMIMMYQEFLRTNENKNNPYHKLDRKMGYLANVNDAKELLEKLYKSK